MRQDRQFKNQKQLDPAPLPAGDIRSSRTERGCSLMGQVCVAVSFIRLCMNATPLR